MSPSSPDEIRRWEAWQRAYAVSARRSERVMRYVALALLGSMVIALTIAVWL